MVQQQFLLFCALCLLAVLVTGNSEVTVLTDANFEHDTQATTGSTTGRWLVLFHNRNNQAEVQELLTAPPTTAAGEEDGDESASLVEALLEEGVVVGTMDISNNPETVARLKIPGTPHALMLAKGKLYRTNSWDDIKDFAISEYEIQMSENIPPLPSALDAIMAHPNGKMGLIGVAGSLLLLVLAVVARMARPAAPATTKKKN